MTPQPNPAVVKFMNMLPAIEKLLLGTLVIGIVLHLLHMGSLVITVSLFGLAGTFFLMAYRPLDMPKTDDEKFGMSDLVALMILPKMLWIGSAVSAIAIAFSLFDPAFQGNKQLLLIAALTLGGAATLFVIFMVAGVKHLNVVMPILVRAIPCLLIDFYVLYMK
jgi:hypothetical protein